MRLREHTVIERRAAEIWPFIICPDKYQRSNTKIIFMDLSGEFRLRQLFTTRYQWNNKQLQCTSVVTEIHDAKLFELRHSTPLAPGFRADMEIWERITLEQNGARTSVTKIVLIK